MNDTARIYTIHSLDEARVDTRVRGVAALTEDEARALTTQIQRTTVRLWLLVTEAHDRKAHLALGYETWADYAKAELNMSESRSYQLLDTGHVMKALAAGGIDVQSINPPPARVVARVKDRLTEVRKAAEKAVRDGVTVDEAVRALAREARPPSPVKTGSGAAAAAASSAGNGGTTLTVVPEPRKAGNAHVSCPACAGTGKVTQAAADRLLEVLGKL